MENEIHSYKDLIVWQKAMSLVEEIYFLTNKFPRDEIYGIISQMKRCAVSIPSNIAEGRRRGSKKDFYRFLQISYGSGAELETQLEISKRLKFCPLEEFKKSELLLEEVMKILNKIINNSINN